MKKICGFLVFWSLACCFYSCAPLEIDFSDPQDITSIEDVFTYLNNENNDLVDLFGEENIHFGPIPPSWHHINDSISFEVDGMDIISSIRYIFSPNGDPFPSATPPPTYDASVNRHLFFDQDQCLFDHKMSVRDTWGNYHIMDLEKVFIIGHDSLFTTYYKGKIEGNGNPTVIMLISGTLVFETDAQDSIIFKGVRDYIYGKKILDYETQPTNAYAPGTIEIKKHPGLSPSCEWDDK